MSRLYLAQLTQGIYQISGFYRPAATLVFRPSPRSLLMGLLITGSYLMNVYLVVKVLCFRCNNFVVSSHILEKKKQFAAGLEGLLSDPDRAILRMEKNFH